MRIGRVVAFISLFIASPALWAAGVVNTCNEASLNAALSGGGTVTFSCSGTIVLTSTITITANTTIDASGQNVIISGNNQRRILTISGGVTVNLLGLTFSQESDGSSGGAIVVITGGVAIISNCTFASNSTGIGGGAIAVGSGGSATINNSTFSGNSSTTGGAIRSDGGTATITNSTFSGNSALNQQIFSFSGSGGTIYATGLGTTTITNSTFSGNSSNLAFIGSGGGGAIFSTNGTTITNSTFSGNTALLGATGAGIYKPNGTVNVYNSIFFSANGECTGVIIDGGYNLSEDSTCNFSGTGSQQNVTARNLAWARSATTAGLRGPFCRAVTASR